MKMPCCCVLSTVCPAGMGDAMAIHYEADAWTGIVGGKGLVTQCVQLEAKPMDRTHCNSKGCALPCAEFLWVINMMVYSVNPAGMGDAMATHYEAKACAANPKAYTWMHPLTYRPPLIASAIGEACCKTLYELVSQGAEMGMVPALHGWARFTCVCT